MPINKESNGRKIFSISMVKNEADIIESFVRYHQHIFDGMVFLDNMSTDRTPKILEKLKEEGLPVLIFYDNDQEFAQSEKTTELMYNTFRQFHPDIILPLDADEFLVSTNPPDHPRDILNKIDLEQLHRIKWRTYVLNEHDNEKELFIPKRMTYAREDHHENNGKVIVTTFIAEKFSGILLPGNHRYGKNGEKEGLKANTLEELKLAHFPIRSLEQYKSKILLHWINRISRKIKPRYLMKDVQAIKQGKCNSKKYLIQLTKEFHTDEKLKDITIVHKPVDLTFCNSINVKYTTKNEVNALLNLLENFEAMARISSKKSKRRL